MKLLRDCLMNRFIFLLIIFITNAHRAFCIDEAISAELKNSMKSTSGEPSFLNIICALIFVVALIYITGIIYSKLNIVGAKTVKKQFKNYDLSKAIVVSTTQLGQHKNIHVIELEGKRYLIGATPNSINLLKELSSEKIGDIEEEADKTSIGVQEEPLTLLFGEKEDELSPVDEFDVHKKYL